MITIHAETSDTLPIHREAPSFAEQSTEQEVLVTGIKVILVACKIFWINEVDCDWVAMHVSMQLNWRILQQHNRQSHCRVCSFPGIDQLQGDLVKAWLLDVFMVKCKYSACLRSEGY